MSALKEAKPLNIGIVGLGTVGAYTVKILQQHAQMLALRVSRPINVVAVSARDRKKDRGITLKGITWIDNPLDMAKDPNIDVIVELVGGADGIAREVVEAALNAKKSVVTANKALIAHHGIALAKIAEANNVMLAYEAAVAGGIPIIKAMRDGLAANEFSRVIGILNGTCNYILTSMWETKRSYDVVLKEAQDLGYAEAEPSFDVDGIDTAHKTAILSSLAYGCPPDIDAMQVEGIRRISLMDMEFAAELGYVIKLLGVTERIKEGILQRVHPCMVRADCPLGSVSGAYNAVLTQGDAVADVLFEGQGAGGGPTASSVVADIMDIARAVAYNAFTLPVEALKPIAFCSMDHLKCSYYLRLNVIDRQGVLAEVTDIFRHENISLRSFLQHSHAPDEPVYLVLTTHETDEPSMLRAIAAMSMLETVKDEPYMIRIENI